MKGLVVVSALVGACAAPERSTGFSAANLTARLDESSNGASGLGLASPGWQTTLTAIISQNNISPGVASRGYALLGVAQYRAVQQNEHNDANADGSLAEAPRPGVRSHRASDRGAVAGASAVVLAYLFPSQQRAFEDMVTAQRDASPGNSQNAFERGEAIGRAEGALIVTRAQGDGFNKPFTGTIPVGPGLWISNTTPPTVSAGQLPQVLPWFLTSASQFRPPPPPAFGSPEYLAALAEIRQISDTRTPEQIQIATFWAMNAAALNPGEPTPPGYWVGVGTDGINSHNLSELEATHLYALLAATMFDASIGCWDGKLTYWMIRPYQADPAITILPTVGKPNHPSYPSAHSCFSSSGAEVISTFFPEERAQNDALVIQAGLARMYGGIHYRFDVDAGRVLGINVARFAIATDAAGQSALTP